MKNWFNDRRREPTTWISLGAILTALGQLFKDDHMPQIGQAVAETAPVIASGNWETALPLLIGGALGAFMPERKK